jgi:hypothetical protein
MKDRGRLEPIVERIVGQLLDNHVAQLRTEMVRRVAEELEASPPSPPSGSNSADLARAVAAIQLGASQREILRALLDACGHYAARVALFVVKGSQATGWQGCGFAKNDALKDFQIDVDAPALSRAISGRGAVSAQVAEVDSHFLETFGAPGNGQAHVMPLVLKDKVAALVYADAGTDAAGTLDAGAVELLVLATSAWLEVNSLRKQVHKEPAALGDSPRTEPVPAFSDPFAAHSPTHAFAASASAEATASAAAPSPVIETPHFDAQHQTPVGQVETPAAEPLSAALPEDQETHRKAQRFARLLVDEIKLYNQAKVAAGREHKDVYDRLKDTIEKSRSTYQKRYGTTVAAAANYFEDELIRSLAEDDVSVMGTNFRH